MKLINKDALVAEIEKCKKDIPTGCTWGDQIEEGSRIGHEEAYDRVLRFIDTLEVKEVDWEKECSQYFEGWTVQDDLGLIKPDGWSCIVKDLYDIAKHFFELGLRVNNEKEK